MIEIQEKYDAVPICPHCDAALNIIHFQQLRSMLGKRFVYFCPNCRKILGISHRKGFWMG